MVLLPNFNHTSVRFLPLDQSILVILYYHFFSLAQPMDLALPIAMGVLFAVFITGVIVYAVYSQFWDWRPQTLINDSLRSNVQYEGL